MSPYKTEQEAFWAGVFGDEYTDRNAGSNQIAANLAIFAKVLHQTKGIKSLIEFGANRGLNLQALRLLLPQVEMSAIEINQKAVVELEKMNGLKIYHQSILDFTPDYKRDLSFISGVLIHINPDALQQVYELIYQSSSRYICVMEYYNPTPVEVTYRGHTDKLFKRDFAGEILDKYDDLSLVDYGFFYHRDNNFPCDDLTWFLLEKH